MTNQRDVLGEQFHAHLNVCPQCKEHPFDLCRRGHELLTSIASTDLSEAMNVLGDSRIPEKRKSKTEPI